MSVLNPAGQMLYGRKYRLAIETWRGDVIEVPDLRYTFTVTKNFSQIYQFAEITIYNLSPETETDIFENGKNLVLLAGYETGPYGLVFSGAIRQPIRGKVDDTTYFLKLVCLDGDYALNLGFSSLVLTDGQTPQMIAQQVCRSSTIPFDIRIEGDLSQQATQRGKSIFGKPGDYLRSLALANNAAFYFDNGVAYISSLNNTPSGNIPLINAETGMIGMPQQTDQGIEIRTLINPNIAVGRWFKVNNQDIVLAQIELNQLQTLLDRDGLYRVIELVATGDTRGNDWYFDIQAISQTGILPQMLTSPDQTGM